MKVEEFVNKLKKYPQNMDVSIAKGRLIDFNFDIKPYVDIDTNQAILVLEPKRSTTSN